MQPVMDSLSAWLALISKVQNIHNVYWNWLALGVILPRSCISASFREQLAASSSAGQSHSGMNVIKTDNKEYSAVKDSHLDDVMIYL